jgi:hypothetical protein
VLCATTTGYIGLCPHGTRDGDLIFFTMGADVPYVLRPLEDHNAYELIGEAYVQGAMHGEVVQMDNIPVQDIMVR